MEILGKVIIFCDLRASKERLISILNEIGVVNYISMCELKSDSFLEKCEKYLDKKKVDLKPGDCVLLKKIGNTISNMSEKEFNKHFLDEYEEEIVKNKEKFPLLDELNRQVGKKNYSEPLKDMSVWIRCQAGRLVHQFLSDNLPMPKTSATDKYLQNFDYVNEGELQVIKPNSTITRLLSAFPCSYFLKTTTCACPFVIKICKKYF